MTNRYPILSVLTTQEVSRFWLKVPLLHASECWPWQGAKMKKNYGGYTIIRNGKSMILTASRVAYALHYGTDPAELDVLHKCDNPPCCNPAHLFLGTNGDNILDRVKKGRSVKGDDHWTHRRPEQTTKGQRHGQSKLTDADVVTIRTQHMQGVTRKAIAEQFQVTIATIGLIVTRKTWKHL